MPTTTNRVSAFDQGRRAGSDKDGPIVENPFGNGTPEHNNFEVGRRFGAKNTSPVLRPAPQDPTAGEAS